MQRIQEIAEKINKNGGNLYLVGGAIRNKMLGIPIKDRDYCVTGLTKEKFQDIFPEARLQGKSFPVFVLYGDEFALARTEIKIGKGHKNFEIHTSPNFKIEEDLKRRDITINSIAQEILTGKIIDPYNGVEDLRNRCIRKTSEAFLEDPLRAYRVARFAATLDFKVEKETINTMKKLKDELFTLSKERVFEEFRKALLSNKPSIFFNVLKQAGLLGVHFKEIEDLIGKTQIKQYNMCKDKYTHTMDSIDNSTKLTNKAMIRFSVLVHHFENENKLVKDFGNRVGIPQNWIKCGKVACKWYREAKIFEEITLEKKLELIEKVDKSLLTLEGLKIVVIADKLDKNENIENIISKIKFVDIGNRCLKEVTGTDIRKKFPQLQGKQIGEELHKSRIKWLKGIDTQ